MTQRGAADEPLTPADDAAVSRRLAEAGGPLSMPDDVSARLQQVLDDLTAERTGRPEDAEAADVARLRTRRRWPRALLAAAAVLVVGYGAAGVIGDGSLSGSQGESQTDSGAAGSAEDFTAGDAPDAGADEGSDNTVQGAPDRARRKAESSTAGAGELGRFPPRLRSARLDVGVRRALRFLGADVTDGLLLDDVAGGDCTVPETGPRADWVPVLYDSQPAVLVARTTADGSAKVTVVSCAGDVLDRTVVTP